MITTALLPADKDPMGAAIACLLYTSDAADEVVKV